MGTEREAMTLEQVRDWFCERQRQWEPADSEAAKKYRCMADAIDAYLSRAAEPVGLIVRDLCEMERPEIDAPDTIIVSTDDLIRVLRRYLHPSEDARDAARLEWLADAMRMADLNHILGCCPMHISDLRTAIDAAMNGGDDEK